MKAVIMAGGKGTRLRPLTSNQPKPMISIANKPCMEHIVNLLKRHGFEEIVTTLGFMPEVIEDYFGDGSEWGVKMDHSIEDEPMGTAGSVKLAEDSLTGRFIVVSGDALTDADLSKAVEFHEERGAEATLVLQQVDDPSEFGIVVVDDEGRVERFLEKPDPDEVFSYTANTGIYVLEPGILEEIPADEEYDFADDLFPKLLDEGRSVYGYVTEKAYWEDIGNIDQYLDAQKAVLAGEVNGIEIPGERHEGDVYLGSGVETAEDALEGPVVVGNGVRIASGAHVGPYSVLGSNVSVESGAKIIGSTVAEGSVIGAAELDGALVGRSCKVGANARLLEDSALGDNVTVGEAATVEAGVSVFPEKTVGEGSTVSEDVT
ncbi:MAG: NDP-sugar synthase [Actinomycetota bacterium]|nr:NDP-sugar synthase [Actinomycetota bacterium]